MRRWYLQWGASDAEARMTLVGCRMPTVVLLRPEKQAWAPGRGAAFDRSLFEPMHFVMERRTLLGVQQLAEGEGRHRWVNHLVFWRPPHHGAVQRVREGAIIPA